MKRKKKKKENGRFFNSFFEVWLFWRERCVRQQKRRRRRRKYTEKIANLNVCFFSRIHLIRRQRSFRSFLIHRSYSKTNHQQQFISFFFFYWTWEIFTRLTNRENPRAIEKKKKKKCISNYTYHSGEKKNRSISDRSQSTRSLSFTE